MGSPFASHGARIALPGGARTALPPEIVRPVVPARPMPPVASRVRAPGGASLASSKPGPGAVKPRRVAGSGAGGSAGSRAKAGSGASGRVPRSGRAQRLGRHADRGSPDDRRGRQRHRRSGADTSLLRRRQSHAQSRHRQPGAEPRQPGAEPRQTGAEPRQPWARCRPEGRRRPALWGRQAAPKGVRGRRRRHCQRPPANSAREHTQPGDRQPDARFDRGLRAAGPGISRTAHPGGGRRTADRRRHHGARACGPASGAGTRGRLLPFDGYRRVRLDTPARLDVADQAGQRGQLPTCSGTRTCTHPPSGSRPGDRAESPTPRPGSAAGLGTPRAPVAPRPSVAAADAPIWTPATRATRASAATPAPPAPSTVAATPAAPDTPAAPAGAVGLNRTAPPVEPGDWQPGTDDIIPADGKRVSNRLRLRDRLAR